jgi:formylglycine-generating enzyme required for sulfatase activity
VIAPTRFVGSGTFAQGDDHHYPEEAPARTVHVGAFSIEVHPVTNAQFAAFVADTGYVTTAERDGAAVFVPAAGPVDFARPEMWWRHDSLACWRRPTGGAPLSADHDDHPVVAVTHADATAYAAWCGGRLPTESEWEWAASGGMALPATWPLADDGMLLANVWLGEFPWRSLRRQPPGTMPVGAFPPNANGLFDMLGNVWELTADAWSLPGAGSPCCAPHADPAAAAVVAKGGSFLCAANYCRRYRPAARHRQPVGEAACHIGFRCAYDVGTASADGGPHG